MSLRVPLALTALSLVVGGCFPPAPQCDEGCVGTGEGGTDPTTSNTTPGGPTTGTGTGTAADTEPTTGSTVDPSTATESETETDTEDETTGETDSSSETDGGFVPLPCGAAGPLVVNDADPDHTVHFDVSTPGFELRFDRDQRHALTEYRLDGQNMLYTGGVFEERYASSGVIGLPGGTVYSFDNISGGNLEVSVLAVGPALVQFLVLWGDHSAPVEDRISGSTIFTITPDGRIVQAVEAQLFGAAGQTHWANTFTALDADLVTEFDSGGSHVEGPTDTVFEVAPFDMHPICGNSTGCDVWLRASGETHEMTMAGHRLGTDGSSWTGEVAGRITELRDEGSGPQSVALQFDWRRGSGSVHEASQDYPFLRGAFMTHGGSVADGCGPDLAQAFLQPPLVDDQALSGASAAVSTWEGFSGDYDTDGYFESGGFYGFFGLGGKTFDASWDGDLPSALMFIESGTPVSSVSVGGVEVEQGVWLTQVEADEDGPDVAWLYLGMAIDEGDVVSVTLAD